MMPANEDRRPGADGVDAIVVHREPPFVCPKCGGNRLVFLPRGDSSSATRQCPVCYGAGLVWPPPLELTALRAKAREHDDLMEHWGQVRRTLLNEVGTTEPELLDTVLREQREAGAALRARVEALEAALAEARKDGERLDWMDANDPSLGRMWMATTQTDHNGDHGEIELWYVARRDRPEAHGETLRAAIDAARQADGQEVGR